MTSLTPTPSDILDYSFLVQNLSFFCQEEELLRWFSEYGEVTSVRLFRNRGVMAIVTMSTSHGADEMVRLFHGQFLMGRHLRLYRCSDSEICQNLLFGRNMDGLDAIGEQSNNTVHVQLSSNFSPTQLVIPSEGVLRKYFLAFGAISDVEVVDYENDEINALQRGRAVITFCDSLGADRVRASPAVHYVNGIVITFSALALLDQ